MLRLKASSILDAKVGLPQADAVDASSEFRESCICAVLLQSTFRTFGGADSHHYGFIKETSES
jgi:hypothetical protein